MSTFNPTHVGAEKIGRIRQFFLGHALHCAQLLQPVAKGLLELQVEVTFHRPLYLLCALIRTHTNSYITKKASCGHAFFV